MILLFGPVTVSYNGTDLGKTYGGARLTLEEETVSYIDTSNDLQRLDYATHGEGELRLKEYSGNITLEGDVALEDWGEVVLTGDSYKVTLPSCRLLFPKTLSLGRLRQEPFEVRLVFRRDPASGTLLSMEDLP
ncbi:MAG: hypothetical protein DRO11_02775 [Methanobacteriota archaeon]|nr:MAG: hypothetical protein DRO11_02775 [Euryarchaeota archaeon]